MTAKGHQEKPQKEEGGELTVRKQNAIDLLVTGLTDREVAEQVGVSRETVTRWRNHDFAFIAELNKQRKALWGSAQDRLRALVPRAVDTLAAAVEGGSIQAAVAVLKAAKVYGEVAAPQGPEDSEGVRRAQEAAAQAMRKDEENGEVKTFSWAELLKTPDEPDQEARAEPLREEQESADRPDPR